MDLCSLRVRILGNQYQHWPISVCARDVLLKPNEICKLSQPCAGPHKPRLYLNGNTLSDFSFIIYVHAAFHINTLSLLILETYVIAESKKKIMYAAIMVIILTYTFNR